MGVGIESRGVCFGQRALPLPSDEVKLEKNHREREREDTESSLERRCRGPGAERRFPQGLFSDKLLGQSTSSVLREFSSPSEESERVEE